MQENIVIGIEGLVGSGKTSICIDLLDKIPNSIVLHGGNIYRAIVYAILSTGVKLEELESLMKNVDVKEIIDKYNIEVRVRNRQTCVYINGKLIDEEELQSEKNSMAVSIASNKANNENAFKFVRNLVDELKKKYNVIFSGRALMQIYPKLNYHFLITADLDERVNRKYNQYNGKVSKEELKEHICKRDELQEASGFYKKYNNTIIVDVTDCNNVHESSEKIFKMLILEKIIKVNDYVTKSNLPASDYVINPYVGCPHGCKYCYASFMKRFTGHQEEWGTFIDIKQCDKKINIKKLENKTVFLSSVTDCYNKFEEKYKLTRNILEQLLNSNCKLNISTKSNLILRDIDILKQFKDLTVAMSINTLDENFRKDMDNASTIKERLECLKELHRNGIYTILFISPIFPYITDFKKIIEESKDYVNEYWFENLNLRGDYKQKILYYIQENYPNYINNYTDIYIKGDKTYWVKLSKEIEQYCKENNIKYKNYFYHEELVKNKLKEEKMLKKGDLCKHFKGKSLEEKNIYEILETGVKYSGDSSERPIENLVVYRNIFQNKIFARELEDLIEELPREKQEMYGQKYRVEKLTKGEIEEVKKRLQNKN